MPCGRKTKWWFLMPGWFYAGNTPVAFRTEREARAWVRDYYNMPRLPRHCDFWRMT